MSTRQPGTSNLRMTPIGFGAWACGERHGRSPGEVAVAWVLRDSAVTGAIVGARRPDQVRSVVGGRVPPQRPGAR